MSVTRWQYARGGKFVEGDIGPIGRPNMSSKSYPLELTSMVNPSKNKPTDESEIKRLNQKILPEVTKRITTLCRCQIAKGLLEVMPPVVDNRLPPGPTREIAKFNRMKSAKANPRTGVWATSRRHPLQLNHSRFF